MIKFTSWGHGLTLWGTLHFCTHQRMKTIDSQILYLIHYIYIFTQCFYIFIGKLLWSFIKLFLHSRVNSQSSLNSLSYIDCIWRTNSHSRNFRNVNPHFTLKRSAGWGASEQPIFQGDLLFYRDWTDRLRVWVLTQPRFAVRLNTANEDQTRFVLEGCKKIKE